MITYACTHTDASICLKISLSHTRTLSLSLSLPLPLSPSLSRHLYLPLSCIYVYTYVDRYVYVSLSLSLSISIHIYTYVDIYIHIERERERGRESVNWCVLLEVRLPGRHLVQQPKLRARGTRPSDTPRGGHGHDGPCQRGREPEEGASKRERERGRGNDLSARGDNFHHHGTVVTSTLLV